MRLPRKLLLLCALGAGVGAASGATLLAFALRGEEPAAAAVGLGKSTAAAPSAVRSAAAETTGNLGHAAQPRERAPQPSPATPASAPPPAASVSPEPAQAAAPPATAEPEPAASKAAAHEPRAERRREKLIDKPSREQVIAAMSRVQGDVRACYGSSHGVATADLTVIGRSGRITTAHIDGMSGSVGSCIARAVRKAKFPKFAAESISIRYPMSH